jgi:hypothetical protein
MQKSRVAGWAVAATILTLTPGCVGGDSGDGRPTQEGSHVRAAEDSPSGVDARDGLANAIATASASGRYRQTVTTPGLEEPYYQVAGQYDVAGERFTADMAFWNSEVGATRTIKHTFVDARGFQQAEGWGGRAEGCWLVFDSDSRSAVTRRADLASAEAPGAVLALRGARGLTWSPSDDDVIDGSLRLGVAVSLMLPGFIRQQGTPPDGTVPATFTVDSDGELASWEVLGRDVVQALEAAGEDVRSGFARGLDAFTLEVSYDDLGESVTVTSPPRSRWMSAKDMEAGRGC